MCIVHMSQACLLSHAAFPQTGLQVLCVGINTEVATVRGPCGSPPPCVAQQASYLTRSAMPTVGPLGTGRVCGQMGLVEVVMEAVSKLPHRAFHS